MMVVLNSRTVIQTQDESAMFAEHLRFSTSVSNPRPAFRTWSGDVSDARIMNSSI